MPTPGSVKQLLIPWRDYFREIKAEFINAAFSILLKLRNFSRKPHNLPGELILTLTSYSPRFPNLHKTIRSLLLQTISPDKIILWISEEEEQIPAEVMKLKKYGLEIKQCPDSRSYKKIIPALCDYPNAFLVTADDDLYYEPRWLETITRAFVNEKVIVCRRAHRPTFEGVGFAPYLSWEHDVVTDGSLASCLFPTSGAGVLFPPGSLASEVTQQDFLELCPFADDVWLFVMALRAGTRFRQVGGGFAQVPWKNSQTVSLMQHNLTDGGNDRQLQAVLSRFPVSDTIFASPLGSQKTDDTASL